MSLFSKVSGSCLLAVTALAASAPAAAQPQPAEPEAYDATAGEQVSSHIIVNGAMKDPAAAETAVQEDETIPELPVVYEDDAQAAKVTAPAAAAPPASPAS